MRNLKASDADIHLEAQALARLSPEERKTELQSARDAIAVALRDGRLDGGEMPAEIAVAAATILASGADEIAIRATSARMPPGDDW